MLKKQLDSATQGKKRNIKTVRDRRFGKELISLRTELKILLKVCYAMLNIVFRIVLLSLGLLWSAGDNHSNSVLFRTPRNDKS